MPEAKQARWKCGERGASLLIVAAGLVMLLAAGALAIDLGMLYVARNETQRAADAAALAGAAAFVNSGCTSAAGGCIAGGYQESMALAQAQAAGSQNYIVGQPASILTTDVTFTYPNPEEPEITVGVARTAARGAPVSTLFAKVFGVSSVDVSAAATAEAFNPSGSSVPVGFGCLVPFLVPNCDPVHTSPANASCAGGAAGYFINPSTGQIQNPGTYPVGVQGEPWQLHSNAAPSQWYLVAYGSNNQITMSANQLRQYISQCTPQTVSCGATINTYNGKSVGPTDQGTDSRINASGDGLGQGQDSINTAIGPPFPITGGANNPNPALVGQTFYGPSASLAVVPLYDGHALNPSGDTVSVVGFMQLFIQDATHRGNDDMMDTVVLNVSGCDSGGDAPGSTPPVTSNGAAPIPIRLIRAP
ncbi:MAG TPA: pilus assembly protein TadG-related protein [Candidatus Acidoferrales bacterium]|nr:pilus assembly protein TadG-related protein [Candidatus Acidoferrales bacterium]